MTHHHLKASAKTCHWGFFDAALPPVLTVASGDSVTIDTVTGAPELQPGPGSGMNVLPEISDIHAHAPRQLPGHILTGPVAVEGALPGDVLQVDILDITPRTNWGYNVIRPLAGTLQSDFHETRILHIPMDLNAKTAALPFGMTLDLKPFFGVMGTAPPPAWGRVTSIVPRAFGGNLDNKELMAGTTIFLPCFTEGGRFSCGDGHGVQGDGEVCVTALETALQGTFRFTLRKDLGLRYPRAETPTQYLTMGMDPDLDRCVEMALRDMIVLLGETHGLSREDAYTLCSLAADLRVTQTVNGSKGVHCVLDKAILAKKAA